MLNRIKFIISFFILLAISTSQQRIDQSGLGFEFHSFPLSTVDMTNGTTGNGMGIYLPVKARNILFEPYFYHGKYKQTSTYDGDNSVSIESSYSTSTWTVLGGMFLIKNSDKSSSYTGIRIGKEWVVEENSYTSNGEETIEKEEEDVFIIAPTVGIEYHISRSLSFGAEAMYYMVIDEEENSGVTTKTTTASISPRFIIRFYL